MRAVALHQFGGSEVLLVTDLPLPAVGPGEVRIRIVASGINPVDWKIREGYLSRVFPHAFPLVPGWECAGFIDAVGEGATRFLRGDAVYSYTRLPTVQHGTYAEYISVPETSVATAPGALLLHEAAGVPLAGLTAYQGLFSGQTDVKPGSTVLVHAASGGVGMFVAQLARIAGATVIGTAGTSNQDFLRKLGVHHCIDYSLGDFRDAVRAVAPGGVNVVFDCVGKDTLARSYELVAPGGRLTGIVDTPNAEEAARYGLRQANYHFVQPDGAGLAALAELFDGGGLKTFVSAIYPLGDAGVALDRSREGRTRGKAVLVM